MVYIEYTLLFLMICLGIITSVSDIREGIIPNKLLVLFAVFGIVLDTVYYGSLARDMVLVFIGNVLVNTIISLCLYGTHTLAGGDCKLVPVLSLLYPAGMYLRFGTSEITLAVAICIAVFYGYAYLLFSALWKIIIGEIKLEKNYILNSITSYLVSYFYAMICIVFVTLIFALFDRMIIRIDPWLVWIICIIAAWNSGRITILKNKGVICLLIGASAVLAIYLRIIPISLNPRPYLLTALLLICRMTIRMNLYESIHTSRIKKGMILSTFSSIAMQNSKIEGLPGLSSEDLRDRLSESEAESVRRWGNTKKGMKELIIVKKIPFAIFLAMGFISYYLIWRIVI